MLIGVILFSVRTAPNFRKQLLNKPKRHPKTGLVDEIATAIKDQNLAPGETVQPLDWTISIQACSLQRSAIGYIYIYDSISIIIFQNLRFKLRTDFSGASSRNASFNR